MSLEMIAAPTGAEPLALDPKTPPISREGAAEEEIDNDLRNEEGDDEEGDEADNDPTLRDVESGSDADATT